MSQPQPKYWSYWPRNFSVHRFNRFCYAVKLPHATATESQERYRDCVTRLHIAVFPHRGPCLIRLTFRGKWIRRDRLIARPSRSPNLTRLHSRRMCWSSSDVCSPQSVSASSRREGAQDGRDMLWRIEEEMEFHREIFRESKEADAEHLQIKLKCFLILRNSYHIIVAFFVCTIFH